MLLTPHEFTWRTKCVSTLIAIQDLANAPPHLLVPDGNQLADTSTRILCTIVMNNLASNDGLRTFLRFLQNYWHENHNPPQDWYLNLDQMEWRTIRPDGHWEKSNNERNYNWIRNFGEFHYVLNFLGALVKNLNFFDRRVWHKAGNWAFKFR